MCESEKEKTENQKLGEVIYNRELNTDQHSVFDECMSVW